VVDIYFGSTFPTTWFNLPHAWGKLNRKSDVFRFQFMLRIYMAMPPNLLVIVSNGFNHQMPQFQISSAYTERAMAKM